MGRLRRVAAAAAVLVLLVFQPMEVLASSDDPLWHYPDWSGAVVNEDGSITYKPIFEFTAGELFEYFKQTLSFGMTQLGCFFSGSTQELILNWEAYLAWEKDRYAKGYDGTDWNAVDYFTKEVVRNADGTVTLSDRIMDDYVAYTKEILDANCGYYLVNTLSLKNISPSWFSSKAVYDAVIAAVKDNGVVSFKKHSAWSYWAYYDLDGFLYVGDVNYFFVYKDWIKCSAPSYEIGSDGNAVLASPSTALGPFYLYGATSLDSSWTAFVATKDGGYIKVFKTVDAMKDYDAGYQPYYAGSQYANYDSSVDNSITIGGDYFYGNDWVTNNNTYYDNSSTTIINNYGSGITDEQLRQIIDAILEEIRRDDDDGDNGSGGNSGSGSGGGLISLINGLGKLLDFLLDVLGKLIGLVSSFLSGCLNLIDGLTGFTQPFSALLADLMPFVPQELWDVIIAGMTASVGIALWYMFKK